MLSPLCFQQQQQTLLKILKKKRNRRAKMIIWKVQGVPQKDNTTSSEHREDGKEMSHSMLIAMYSPPSRGLSRSFKPLAFSAPPPPRLHYNMSVSGPSLEYSQSCEILTETESCLPLYTWLKKAKLPQKVSWG